MRSAVKSLFNAVCVLLVSPAIVTCWLEARLRPGGERVFVFWSNSLALLPGAPGVFLRRAFFRHVLEYCSADCSIGFGAFFTHRQARVEKGVYIGPYALVGSANLRAGCLIGSRASLLSGAGLHTLGADGRWDHYDIARLERIEIGANAWIGEGAIIMADVGAGSQIAAGAVIAKNVPAGVAMAGNPARFIRNLQESTHE